VPANSAIQLEHLGEARDALGAICAVHGEYTDFFSGVFSRLESMSDVVRARDRQIEELQQQRQLWKQERSALERELEAVRNRAAEMNEAMVQQKHEAELQQSQWSEELKRMRKALQQMAHRLAKCNEEAAEPPSAVANSRSLGANVNSAPDPVLDSVMAQFEVLRKDVARRRETRRS
jgi:chromosome segregation ATPase